jgi:hypothetical protein
MDGYVMRCLVKEIYRCCDMRAVQIINEANEIDGAAQLETELIDYLKEIQADDQQH